MRAVTPSAAWSSSATSVGRRPARSRSVRKRCVARSRSPSRNQGDSPSRSSASITPPAEPALRDGGRGCGWPSRPVLEYALDVHAVRHAGLASEALAVRTVALRDRDDVFDRLLALVDPLGVPLEPNPVLG